RRRRLGTRDLRAKGQGCSRGELSRDFFFQAEDGIRDLTVTGVQTCALPISACGLALTPDAGALYVCDYNNHRLRRLDLLDGKYRSEERRVGKECRYRWAASE